MSIVRSAVRSPVRSPVRSVLGGVNLLSQATAYLGGVTPYHWLDFINNRALYAGADVGDVTQATGYSFTRASDGYYTNSDGTLTNFASGALRRGDRGVLIEGSRTNLLTYSQEFDNAGWTEQRTTVTANAVTAPDGTTTAETMLETVDNGNHAVFQTITKAASSITYALSCHIKPNGRDWAILQLAGPGETNRVRVWFDLTGSGTVGSNVVGGAGFSFVSASIQALANGWYRCVAVITTDTSTALSVFVRPATGDTLIGYAGDITKGLYIWGAQLEAASFASSYVKSEAAAATRAADVLTYTAGVSYPLSLWAEVEPGPAIPINRGMIGADTGSSAERGFMFLNNGDMGTRVTARTESVTTGSTSYGDLNANQVNKVAVRFVLNDLRGASNGTLGTAANPAVQPANPTRITVGGDGGSQIFWSYIRRAAVFNSALTDAQLTTTTS